MANLLDDDELTRLLVEANPARTPLDAEPDADAVRMREHIIANVPVKPRRRFPRLMWASLAVVVTAGAVVAVALFAPQGQAVAVTPVPLVYSDAGSAQDIVDRALDALAADAGPNVPARAVEAASWSLAVDVEEQQSAIVPQFSSLSWNEDMSGHLTVRAGEAYWAHEANGGGSEVRLDGEILVDLDMAPGEFVTPVEEPPGESAADVRAMLMAFGMPEDPTAPEVVSAIVTVLDQWTLTDEQHAEMLDLLVSAGDVQALGATEDRLDRPVDALQTSTQGTSSTLLIAEDSGRIVGIENEQRQSDGIVPAGAVVMYTLWDPTEGSSR